MVLTSEEYGYKFREQNSQNSRNLGNESRQKIYRSWMSNGPQNRKLYKACEKALAVCEALPCCWKSQAQSIHHLVGHSVIPPW
ncbi:MAG: hypothetical protein MJZ20_14015 [Bacteroidaceae bacterium]|nr:hypothetical protein [Bacteroidaceae bacterium]